MFGLLVTADMKALQVVISLLTPLLVPPPLGGEKAETAASTREEDGTMFQERENERVAMRTYPTASACEEDERRETLVELLREGSSS